MPKSYAKSNQELTVPQYFYKQRKSSVWYVRLVPPKHIRHLVTEQDFRRSTGHSDLKRATPVGVTIVAEKLREWDALARATGEHPAPAPVILTDHLIASLCQTRLFSALMSDEEERAAGFSDEELLEADDFCLLTDTAMRAALAQGQASKHWPAVVEEAMNWATDTGHQLSPEDPLLPKLIREFAKVERKSCEAIKARNRGDDAPTPAAPTHGLHTLSSITEEFRDFKSVSTGPEHVSNILNTWRLFIEHVGDIRFDAVSPNQVFDFMTARMHAENKPWSEARAKGFGRRALREIFGLARTKGWMTVANPVDGVEVWPTLSKEDEESRKQPRYPFSDEQLNELFTSPWYDPNEGSLFKGKMREDLGARYWVPLISTHHGNRVSEGVQLVASDFSVKNGMLVLTFRKEIEAKKSRQKGVKSDATEAEVNVIGVKRKGKTEATRRSVPVHPKLVELGLMEFLELRRQADGEHALLFPSSLPNDGGKSPKLGRSYEQAFLRFVRDKLAFGHGFGSHSFRHQLEDRIRDAQVTKGVWPGGLGQQFMGRKKTRAVDAGVLLAEGSEKVYGVGYTPASMLPYINRMDFSGINYPKPFAEWLQSVK